MKNFVGIAATSMAVAATLASLAPASAKVTFVQAGAYSQSGVGIAGPDTVKDGPTDQSTSYGDGYFVSTSDSREDYRFSLALSSSAGAIQFDGPSHAEFFVRTSSIADTLPHENVPHAFATASTVYYFSIDTLSTLSFTAFASPDSPTAAANVSIDFFGIDAPGTVYRAGWFGGSGTSYYSLTAGQYGFVVSAFSDARSADGRTAMSSVANVSLSIDPQSLPGPVPEPSVWVTMLAGFGFVGGAVRRRNRPPVIAPTPIDVGDGPG